MIVHRRQCRRGSVWPSSVFHVMDRDMLGQGFKPFRSVDVAKLRGPVDTKDPSLKMPHATGKKQAQW